MFLHTDLEELSIADGDSKLVQVVELIRAEGREAIPLPGDIRDRDFCRKLVSDAVSGLGGHRHARCPIRE